MSLSSAYTCGKMGQIGSATHDKCRPRDFPHVSHGISSGLTTSSRLLILRLRRFSPQPESQMQNGSPRQVTDLLAQWRAGDREALDALMPLVYEELRRLAGYYLRQERPDHTLQSTALVHEAYMRLVGQNPPEWKSRAHFFGVAARLMRQILVDHARTSRAAKRGGDSLKLTLDEGMVGAKGKNLDILALDGALNGLAQLHPQQSQIVELRFFSGLSIEDTSEVLGISPATVKRNWTTARAWLFREMNQSEQP
jgi:RNA polymerase sigma factor (TIGR02999 family)